jgi:HD-like signal output (HDOD) protein
MCDRMPAFPASVQKVIALTSDINSSPKDLVNVIDHDPVLTMKILKVANSSYFGLSRKIVSINHAVVYLGLTTVKHVALAIAGGIPRHKRQCGHWTWSQPTQVWRIRKCLGYLE